MSLIENPKSSVYLRCNLKPLLLFDVTMGNDDKYESLFFNAGEIWFDDRGVIRTFSVKLSDAVVGNFWLMSINENYQKSLDMISKDLLEFGLKMISNSFFSGGTLIVNLAKFFFEKYGKILITDLSLLNKEMGYVELQNNEIVFKNILNIRNAIEISQLSFFITNNTTSKLHYELSRDLLLWKTYIIQALSINEGFFNNGQRYGYFRISTNAKTGKIYRVESEKKYIIDWNDKAEILDLLTL